MDGVATSNSYLATETKMKNVKSSVPKGGPSHYCPKQGAISSDLQETNDCMSPNPRGSGIHETNSKAEGKLLSCKQYNLEATFNAITLKSECKREELQISFKGQSIVILGIVDHKIVHKESDDDIVYDEMDDSILITSPAWRKTSNAACGMVVLA